MEPAPGECNHACEDRHVDSGGVQMIFRTRNDTVHYLRETLLI